ncbi:hypothetical protein A3K89_10830 [Rhodococcoides kyotonense]|uniref:DUF3558 domain-containing protein n=1 Tax=Rhodococcoides kyotonense TaxID=398843 RepID=A0A177Y9F6_9NOCA|nr:hypothetical protein A3K89_10830 [Rhodococcus kyotonensis]
MRRWVFVLSAAALLVVACGRDVQPEAAAEPTRWDPCTVTDDVIEAMGLDPSSRKQGWQSGVVVEDWDLCGFRAPPTSQSYFFHIRSSDRHTIESIRSDDSRLDRVDLTVNGRDAFRYRTNDSRAVADCNVALPVGIGVVVLSVDFAGGVEPAEDPCKLVVSHATDLEPVLPSSTQ